MEHRENRGQLRQVCKILEEKGYCPVIQITGYLLTEDPTYITSHAGARWVIAQLDRDELLRDMVEFYLNVG